MPRSVTDVVNDIFKQRSVYDSDSPLPQFETEIGSLDPVLEKLDGTIPKDLREYLGHCIPIGCDADFGFVEFHNLENLVMEATDCGPGCDVLPYGFFCFAKEGDGSQFAYCIHDQKIYHVDDGDADGGTLDSIRELAETVWPSLLDFLLYVESECAKGR